MTQSQKSVGVIPARFQVDELHAGHHHLIQEAMMRHEQILIVIGSTGGLPDEFNPLPYEIVQGMVREAYPQARIARIYDHPIGHQYWSRDLDFLIEKEFRNSPAVLYGSRDSFIPYYSGKFPTHTVEAIPAVSGTSVRAAIAFANTVAVRRALIWQKRQEEPVKYNTVDVGIIDRANDRALFIGKKHHEGLLSLTGGFDNVKGETKEEAVKRELGEELPGLIIGPLRHIASVPIDDPRYRLSQKDGVETTLFLTDYLGGDFAAGDDADYFQWHKRNDFMHRLVPWHRPLGQLQLAHWNQ